MGEFAVGAAPVHPAGGTSVGAAAPAAKLPLCTAQVTKAVEPSTPVSGGGGASDEVAAAPWAKNVVASLVAALVARARIPPRAQVVV